MALKGLLNDLVPDAIFKALDDIPVNVTFSSVTNGVYDPVARTRASTTSDQTVQAVLAKFSMAEADESVVPETDGKAIIPNRDLQGTIPKVQDRIAVPVGASLPAGTYHVERLMGVPGSAVHILHIRRQS